MPPPFVSIVVPCRNELQHIGPLLDSVLATDYPHDRLEVLVVDGMSDDGTRAVIDGYARRDPLIRWLDNSRRITPCALNLGIAHARGDVIIRMDAHVQYPPHYIAGLVSWLERTGADNVGGVCVTMPANGTTTGRAIALALSHPFGVGNARFRLGTSEPRRVDTVPFGCYRREVFDRIGLFDEDLVRNQDDEFNLRLIRAGGSVLLVPGIVSYYYARGSLRQLFRMYYQYGYFKPLVIRKIGAVLTLRQLVPALFLCGLLASGFLSLVLPAARAVALLLAAAYAAADLAAAAGAGLKHGVRVATLLAITFPVLHLSYGLGFLRGLLDFILLCRRAPSAVALSR